jgi:hypothetical protein
MHGSVMLERVTGHEDDACGFGGLDERPRLGGRRRKRLLDQDVLAGRDRLHA